jgi:hypothetical protein
LLIALLKILRIRLTEFQELPEGIEDRGRKRSDIKKDSIGVLTEFTALTTKNAIELLEFRA